MQHNSLAVFVAVTITAHTPQRKVQYYNTKLIADVKGVVRPEPLNGLLRKFLDIHKYHLTFRVAPQEWLSRHAMTPRTRAAFRRRAVLDQFVLHKLAVLRGGGLFFLMLTNRFCENCPFTA